MADADFARFLLAKEPGASSLPRADVYRRLVRAAFRTATANAFPETRAVLGEEGFDRLLADFLDAGGPNTPFYRDIPGDLVAWAGQVERDYGDLLQWEWLELVAARHPADLDALEPIAAELIRPNPTMQLAAYARPVEQISAEDPTPEPFDDPLAYLVWRRPRTDAIETHQTGLLLARGLALAAAQPISAAALAELLAREAPGLSRDAILEAWTEVERELRSREGIL